MALDSVKWIDTVYTKWIDTLHAKWIPGEDSIISGRLAIHLASKNSINVSFCNPLLAKSTITSLIPFDTDFGTTRTMIMNMTSLTPFYTTFDSDI